jgi:hypothetical protein
VNVRDLGQPWKVGSDFAWDTKADRARAKQARDTVSHTCLGIFSHSVAVVALVAALTWGGARRTFFELQVPPQTANTSSLSDIQHNPKVPR